MASIRLYTAQSYTWYCIYSCVLTPTQNCRTVLYAQWCKSQVTRMLYDLNHCAYTSSSAGYNCKWSIVYKTVLCDRIDTVSVRSFVFTSGTPACIFGWLDYTYCCYLASRHSTITAANKYSAFGCKSGYKSKGGEQGQNSPFTLIQFMTRICALNGWKLILAKTVPCAVESFTAYVHVLFILSSIDTHFTVVVAKSCSHFVVVKQLRHLEDGWNGARFQTTSTSLVRNNQLPIFFRACCYP